MKPSKKILQLVIIGPSGSGKGTQAELLCEKFGLVHISVGSLFRSEIRKKTTLGKKIEKFVLNGQWVPSDLTLRVLVPQLKKTVINKGFIIDGFPRAPDQPRLLDEVLTKNNEALDLVIHLDIRPEVIMQRRKKLWAKGKSFYRQQRKDETEEAILARIASYQKTIAPIFKYYQKKGILIRIDGERPVKVVYRDILKAINVQVLGR